MTEQTFKLQPCWLCGNVVEVKKLTLANLPEMEVAVICPECHLIMPYPNLDTAVREWNVPSLPTLMLERLVTASKTLNIIIDTAKNANNLHLAHGDQLSESYELALANIILSSSTYLVNTKDKINEYFGSKTPNKK